MQDEAFPLALSFLEVGMLADLEMICRDRHTKDMTGCFWQKEASFVVLSSKVRLAHVTPVASVKVVQLNGCHLGFFRAVKQEVKPINLTLYFPLCTTSCRSDCQMG